MTRADAIARRQAELAVALLSAAREAVARGQPADRELASLFAAHRELGSRDRRFLSNLVFSWFRWRGWLDAVWPKDPPARQAVPAYLLDATDPHPALEILLGQEPPAPAGGLSLADRAAQLAAWAGSAAPPPLSDLVPAWVPGALARPAGEDPDAFLARCLTSFQQRPPTWLRLLVPPGHLTGVSLQPHPQVPGAAAVSGTFHEGTLRKRLGACFEVQDLASQCVGQIAAPAVGESWWDACAGSGGKTLHLAALAGGKARILATDIRDSALEELRRRAQRSAAQGISTRVLDPTRQRPDGRFDGVLLDAPCSGVGTWARNPDMRWRTDASLVTGMAERQRALLRAAAEAVRPGGRLVYAVCTMTAAETGDVVNDFLDGRRDFQPDPFASPLDGQVTDGTLHIRPWDGPGDGMYVARLRRADHCQ